MKEILENIFIELLTEARIEATFKFLSGIAACAALIFALNKGIQEGYVFRGIVLTTFLLVLISQIFVYGVRHIAIPLSEAAFPGEKVHISKARDFLGKLGKKHRFRSFLRLLFSKIGLSVMIFIVTTFYVMHEVFQAFLFSAK